MLTVPGKCDHWSWSYFPLTPLRTDHVMVSAGLSICLFIIYTYICRCRERNVKETVPFFLRALYWGSKLYKLKRSIGNERLNNLGVLWCGCCVLGLFEVDLLELLFFQKLYCSIVYFITIPCETCVLWLSLFLHLALSSDCLLSIIDNIQRAVEKR